MRRIAWFLLTAGLLIAQPKPSTSEQDVALAAIGDYARTWAEKLPNYTAMQSTRRKASPVAVRGLYGARNQTDVIEEQINYIDRREIHKTISINGRTLAEADQKDASFSRGEFGVLLSNLFLPETGATFEWDRFAKLNGRRMYVFRFHVPNLPFGYGLMEGSHTIMVAYKGTFYADVETKAVMRIQLSCIDIPAISTYRSVDLTLDYKPQKVAGQEFVLPSHYTLNARRVDADMAIEATYRDYKRYSSDATIIFDEEDDEQ